MSVGRIVTRLAAVSALNNFLNAPWPTLAGPNIFDSKIEPVEDMKQARAFPCVVVYTDYDKNHWNKGRQSQKSRNMTVTLELLIVQAAQDEGDGFKLDCPVTDSEIEFSLDMLEAQAFQALMADNSAAQVFNYLNPSVENIVSRRGASTEGGHRLAARQLTLEMESIRDPIAGVVPASVAPFLADLEAFRDYAHLVPEIRSLYERGSGQSFGELMARAFGYTQDTLHRIGSMTSTGYVLPPNITFLDPAGRPA